MKEKLLGAMIPYNFFLKVLLLVTEEETGKIIKNFVE